MVVISSFINMRAVWKVTSSELLTKQAMREKNSIIYKKIHAYLTGGSHVEQDQGCKEGGQRTPS
jgi:hypothetical protein